VIQALQKCREEAVVAVDLRMAAVERMLALAAQCGAMAKKDRPSIQR